MDQADDEAGPRRKEFQEPAVNVVDRGQQYNSKQFERIRILGNGSFGVASVNRRQADHSLVVLKEIDLSRFKGEREKLSAINEARIMSTLKHANIIKYYNAYTSESKLIIEMEYASIGTLAAFLSFQMEPLEEQEVLVIFTQITSGLNYLHSRNIIHLDLKMTNIFVTIEGFIKIGDFGIAQYLTSSNHGNSLAEKSSSSHLGTLAYSSPERCIGCETSFKSDIWSLGCILYELITSKPLFGAESLPELVASITRIQYVPIKRAISSGLRETFERMIAREPEKRPSAESLLLIVEQLSLRLQHQKHHKPGPKLGKASKRRNQRFDLSTEFGHLDPTQQQPQQLFLQQATGNEETISSQLNYPHSFVYQVSLGSSNIQLARVNLPPTKRIKEISKGLSHYLVLTYDNIVYGWGSKTHGQLGSCGLSSSSSAAGTANSSPATKLRNLNKTSVSRKGSRSARNSLNAKDFDLLVPGKQSSLAAHSTQSITSAPFVNNNKHLVAMALADSKPTTRPFVINELNNRKIVQVAAGNNFSAFLSKTGIVMTCGDGSTGCLGRGDLRSSFTPCMVESLLNTDVVSIASGPEHVVAVCGNGWAFAWGKNKHGRLGLGAATKEAKLVARPQRVHFLESSKPSQPEAGRAELVIKSVFCGDRCTVFVDSQGACWACGENRFNKLGLDQSRRFKKTLVVGTAFLPVRISALSKYKIITCSLSKNHSSFLTNEGKLIVFGQDIDHAYRLKGSIVREGWRKSPAAGELLKARGPHELRISAEEERAARSAASLSRLSESLLLHKQLIGFRQNKPDQPSDSKAGGQLKYNLNKRQRRLVEMFLKKSRAMKKMQFDCVISVSCRPKFTLALSNDNRVYFWGTRSFRKSEEELHSMLLLSGGELGALGRERPAGARSVEPQLVANCSDDCFVKIGATNSSLMSNIQLMGSDQPIIHAQDPRLRANSLDELWILDYEPSSSGASSRRSSLCSLCSSCSSSSSASACSLAHCSRSFRGPPETRGAQQEASWSLLKHNAILEPQPIVSLYVPSMFNHNGCTLNLVDLFCFDDDRFYLVLDTTVKLQQHSASLASSGALAKSCLAAHNSSPKEPARPRTNSVAGSAAHSSRLELNGGAQGGERLLASRQKLSSERALEPRQAATTSLAEVSQPPAEAGNGNLHVHSSDNQPHKDPQQASLAPQIVCVSSDDNNNLCSGELKLSGSQGAASIEEPRSLSTFAASHIIMSPSMRSKPSEPLKALNFSSENNDLKSNSETSGQTKTEILDEGSDFRDHFNGLPQEGASRSMNINIPRVWQDILPKSRRRRSHKLSLNKSESTTFTCNEFDNESSMPSWVRNEFIQQQQLSQCPPGASSAKPQAPQALFLADSSATDDTYVSGLSAAESELTTLASSSSEAGSLHTDNTNNDACSVIENQPAARRLLQPPEADRADSFPDARLQLEPVGEREEDCSLGSKRLFNSRSELDMRAFETNALRSVNYASSQLAMNLNSRPNCQHSSLEELQNNSHTNNFSRSNSNNPLIEPSPEISLRHKQARVLHACLGASGNLPFAEDRTNNWDNNSSYRVHSSHSTTITNTTVINQAVRRSALLSRSELHLLSQPAELSRRPERNKPVGSTSSLSALRNSFLGKLFC